MTETKKCKRAAALLMAMIFTMVTVFSAVSMPAYAAAKAPVNVTGVKAAAKSTSSIKITWNKAKNAKKYQVYRAASKNGTYKKAGTTARRYFIDKKLKSGKRYYYKVRGINGSKKGKFSKKVYAATKKASLSDVIVDTSAKTVSIKAKVNGDYFMTSTRHFMVDTKGFNKGKGMLSSYCSPKALYNGLVKAGGVSWSKSEGKTLKGGEKNTTANAENKNFSHLDITVSWDGETHKLSECLTTKRAGSTAPNINMVFSGNPLAAAKTPSGCMVCLDSCYIGIAANSSYGLCVIDDKNPTVYARSDVLPEDGTVVTVTFKIK